MVKKYGKDKIGLYRDDGLVCLENINGSQAEQIRKKFISVFKPELKLNNKTETNLKILNFLDVTLNLNTGTHKPYNKPNKNHLYIIINSNHPPNQIKNIPKRKQKRISKLLITTRIFNNYKDL